MKNNTIIFSTMILFGLFSCSSIPPGATAVTPFAKEKYLGKWYEIARLDFKFEKDLINTTATYSQNKNGSIAVENKGYNPIKKEWVKANGKAKFVNDENTAMLKVSFFGPFYAGYNVLAIDSNYQYALVAGSSVKYLWILSREKSIPDDVKKEYLQLADKLGFITADLVWVKHD